MKQKQPKFLRTFLHAGFWLVLAPPLVMGICSGIFVLSQVVPVRFLSVILIVLGGGGLFLVAAIYFLLPSLLFPFAFNTEAWMLHWPATPFGATSIPLTYAVIALAVSLLITITRKRRLANKHLEHSSNSANAV